MGIGYGRDINSAGLALFIYLGLDINADVE